MKLDLIKENPDGSADYTFDLTEDEKTNLLRFAIRRSLEDAIKISKEWEPKEEDYEDI